MNTTPTHISGELKGMFETSHHGNGLALEEIRQNYFVTAQMTGSDDASIGGINVNQSGRNNDASLASDKEKNATRDLLLMTMLNDIEAMEANLSDKYGEDFAENLAAEHLDEDTYMRLMEIDDQDERRRQIAIELQRGIENGTIDPNAIENPDFIEWIDKRAEVEGLVVENAKLASSINPEPTIENGVDNTYATHADTNNMATFDKLFS